MTPLRIGFLTAVLMLWLSAATVGCADPVATPQQAPTTVAAPPSTAVYTTASGQRCPAYPAFPDASCTGPEGDVSLYAGSPRFSTSGQVIENVEVRMTEPLFVPAGTTGVTFRNVRFVYTGELDGTFAMINIQGSNVTFEDCEFDGQGKVGRAINSTRNGNGITVRSSDIHSTGNGIEVSGPLTAEDNYIHDITVAPGTRWHADGIQTGDGETNDNITIRHNTIIVTGEGTSAIFVHGEGSDTAKNVLIQNNLLAGGSFTMYTFAGENFRVIDNAFTTRIWPDVGRYGIWYHSQKCCDYTGVVRSGNYVLEGGGNADK